MLLSKKKDRKKFLGKLLLETTRNISYDDIMADVSEVGFEDGLGSCSLASFVTCGVEHSASVAKESLTQILEA